VSATKPSEERMNDALRKAIAHVQRQVFAGKHEQDRIDAAQWLDEYDDIVVLLRNVPPRRIK
jgi:hypothetical protein